MEGVEDGSWKAYLVARTANAHDLRQYYIDGAVGSGKSFVLASLVVRARDKGWLVLYVPSAVQLVEDGIFQKGKDDMWLTDEIARLMLKSVADQHKELLQELPVSCL